MTLFPQPSSHPFLRLAVLAGCLALLVLACLRGQTPPGADPAEASPVPRTPTPPGLSTPEASNPFGLMLGAPGLSLQERLTLVHDLNAVYFRPNAIRVEDWDGACRECSQAAAAGLKLILSVTNSGGAGAASSPPEDIAAYQAVLREILQAYPVEVLVIENEENSDWFYTGTPEQYAGQLQAACQVAHEFGVACTNGGLVSGSVALVVYDHYLKTGNSAQAEDFAARAFTREERQKLGKPVVLEVIEKTRGFLALYPQAGLDYLNFHWYIADPQALEEAAAFMRAEVGLPLLTNEIGQTDENPETTRLLLAKTLELGLPYAVWFSIDSIQSRALINPDGSLRPTGEAFRDFLLTQFPSPTN